MKAVDNLENIKLLNDRGEEVEGAIFNNVYELWDQEQKQLTLILDPARVKTGLAANESLGRALQPGGHFQLVIENAEDIHGNRLKEPYVKDFYVLKEDKEMPDTENWQIDSPKFKSREPLIIHFPQIMDRMSLLTKMRILDSNNEMVKGTVEVVNQETGWRFYPEEKWTAPTYTLQINSRFADPCGNNLNGLFDHEPGALKNETEGAIVEIKIPLR